MNPRLPCTHILLFFHLFLSFSLFAQQEYWNPEQGTPIRFEGIGPEEGLPHKSVQALFQDHMGFIWLGTPAGLVKYDGYRFKTYSYEAVDSSAVGEKRMLLSVNAIAEDAVGDLWIGCRNDRPGKPLLFRFDRKLEKLISYPLTVQGDLSIISNGISQIHIGQSFIWILADRLFRLPAPHRIRDGNEKIVASHDGFHPDTLGPKNWDINSLYEDREGRIWLPGRQGIYQWLAKPDSLRFYEIRLPLASSNKRSIDIRNLVETNDGRMWAFPSLKGYLVRFHPEDGSYQVLRDEAYQFQHIMLPTSSGRLWFGNSNGRGGLRIFDMHSAQIQKVDIQLDDALFFPNNRVLSMLQDSSEVIWVGTRDGPLLKYESLRGNFHWLQHRPNEKHSLTHNWVTGFQQDRSGHYWISTFGGGLHRWNREKNIMVHFPSQPGNPNSPLSNHLVGLEIAPDGKIWFGEGFSAGSYDPATGRFAHYRESGTVFTVYNDAQNRIWLAKFGGGLRRYDPVQDDFVKIGMPDPNDPEKVIYPYLGGIRQDSRGALWLGSYSPWIGGFFRFDPETERFQTFELPEAHDFCEDRHGYIWIASTDGLYRFDPETENFRRYGKSEGLPNNVVQAIVEDDSGQLWIATDNGLSCFDTEKEIFRNYFQTDGLPANEFYYPAYKNGQGGLFFWGKFGVLYFHPDSILDNTIPPKLAFTGIDLSGKPVRVGENKPLEKHISLTREIHFSHWQNDLTIHHAALHFKNPEKNSYKVKLDNYDDSWRDAGSQNFANYTNLDPGRYTFYVKAANSDRIWNETGISLDIIIHPPWYWNWWSKIFYVLLTAGIILGVYHFQLNRRLALAEAERLRDLDGLKTRLYTNITHEFRTPLTVIQGLAETSAERTSSAFSTGSPSALRNDLQAIQRNSHHLLDLVNRMLDLSKLEAGELDLHLVQGDILPYLRYVTESFHSYAINQKINLNFYSEEECIIMDYDPEKVLQILSNLLSNALKFTPEYGKVQVLAKQLNLKGEPVLELVVSDTGIGITKEKLPHIFDRFYQAESGANRRAEGTGIGLALTKELIDLMRGTIEVESKVGEGAKFTIKIPVTKDAAPPNPPEGGGFQADSRSVRESGNLAEQLSAWKPLLTPPKGGNTVPSPPLRGSGGGLLLIVEDNRDVMHYLTICLQNDYRLIYARNGREGIDQALKEVPDIIISDVMMPEVDGFELCHTLKNDESTSHIPIILLTAKADTDSKIEGLETGADAYLAKPFEKKELLVRLSKLIELRRALRQRYQQLDFPVSDSDTRFKREDEFLQKVKNAIEAKLDDEQFNVKALYQAVGVSRVQLYRKLKALTDRTPAEMIQIIRLQHARRLLYTTDLRVGEVVEQVGFKEHSYFTKLYKEAFGELPSETGPGD